MNSEVLEMWTVYDHPLDYPDGYMARCWLVRAGGVGGVEATNRVVRSDSLAEVRGFISPGLHCLPRSPGDDPVILETWL